MTDKELGKLKRADLLELLVIQGKEMDRLKAELEEANKKLEDRKLLFEKCGSIAEASLGLHNIFDEAQKAADLYLENVKRMAQEEGQKS